MQAAGRPIPSPNGRAAMPASSLPMPQSLRMTARTPAFAAHDVGPAEPWEPRIATFPRAVSSSLVALERVTNSVMADLPVSRAGSGETAYRIEG